MAKMKKLEDLFHDTLKDVYFAEKENPYQPPKKWRRLLNMPT